MANQSRTTVPVTSVIAVAGLVLLLVAAGAFLAVRQPWNGDGEQSSAEGAPTALISPSGSASLVDPARITVEASSFLAPAGDITYNPRNTLDGDPQTAWNSDAEELIGQTLTFRFAEPVELTALQFVNGYAKNDNIFASNHRLKSVLVTTDQSSESLTLIDDDGPQEISFDFGLTTKVVLEVTEIFEGEGFASPELNADLAVSEVAFVAVQRN
ncbi:MAG: discoidin domain-containing protein [Acidimicrobiales bacterium]